MRHQIDRTTRRTTTAVCALVLLLPCQEAWAGGADFYPGDLGQAIAAIAIFGLLLFILGKWAWGPVVRQLHDREYHIMETIETTRKRQEEASDLLEQYKGKIDRAEAEAAEIMDRSLEKAGVEGDKIIEEARREAREAARRGLADIKQAKRQAIRDMRDVTAELAAEIASSIIDESLTPQVHDHLVDASIKAIGQRAAEES